MSDLAPCTAESFVGGREYGWVPVHPARGRVAWTDIEFHAMMPSRSYGEGWEWMPVRLTIIERA